MAKPNHKKIAEFKEFRQWKKDQKRYKEIYESIEPFHRNLFEQFKERMISGEVQSFGDVPDYVLRIGTLRMVLDEIDGTLDIMKAIPTLNFKEDWNVQVLPNFSGSFANFRVNGHVSVYLDMYNRLGYQNGPYWEVMDMRGMEVYRFAINDTERMLGWIDSLLQNKKQSV